MKKIYSFLALTLAGIIGAGMISCEKEKTIEPDGKIELSTEKVVFTLEAGEESVEVLSGKNWAATSAQDWIQIEPSEISFKIVVTEATEERTGTVTVKNGEDTKTVSVTQTITPITGGGYIQYMGTGSYFMEIWASSLTMVEEVGLDGTGHSFGLQLYSEQDDNSTLPAGTYTLNSTQTAGTALAGYIEEFEFMGTIFELPYGCWRYQYEDGVITGQTALASGKITVSKTGDVYTLTIYSADEDGNPIIDKYVGGMSFTDTTVAE